LERAGQQLPVYLPPDGHLVPRRVQHLTQMRVGEAPIRELLFFVAPALLLYAHDRDILVLFHGPQDRIANDHPVLAATRDDLTTRNINRALAMGVESQPVNILEGGRSAFGNRDQPLFHRLAEGHDISIPVHYARARLATDRDDL